MCVGRDFFMCSSGVCTSWKQTQWLPLPFLRFRQSVSLRSVEQVCLQFSVIRKWHLWAMVRQLCRPHTGLGFPSPGYMAVPQTHSQALPTWLTLQHQEGLAGSLYGLLSLGFPGSFSMTLSFFCLPVWNLAC